jgi:hypothetical protein
MISCTGWAHSGYGDTFDQGRRAPRQLLMAWFTTPAAFFQGGLHIVRKWSSLRCKPALLSCTAAVLDPPRVC